MSKLAASLISCNAAKPIGLYNTSLAVSMDFCDIPSLCGSALDRSLSTGEDCFPLFEKPHQEQHQCTLTIVRTVVIYSPSSTPHQTMHYLERRKRFVWFEEAQQAFLTVLAALGLEGSKPSRILRFMPRRFNLDCQMVGSHLQKVKGKIKGHESAWWSWEGFSESQRKISQRWQNAEFQGYTDIEILEFVNE